ncbi:hypothetical protein BALAC2494_01885 [Bifidobacterium animalis subsp. lactis CNCM I-2494]|uniref:Uncharacterized protein n=1 Tax=Bifidobacterium animalis subsp. lactis CNCM I-2494 TaxID=1042403 RepID=A0A806FGL1_BIFAN|nr:hypothetical protein BALAC2494_01885 [Bifidobacterium animalis subsp. lactis CNCM I-2494]
MRESVCRLRAPQTERVSAALRSHERGKAFETQGDMEQAGNANAAGLRSGER